jgi:spermidine/putrescine transport system permease protein
MVTIGLLAGASLWYFFLLVLPLAIVVLFSFGQRSKIGGYAGGFTLDNFANAWTNSSPFTTSLFMSIGGTSCACSSGCRSPTTSPRERAAGRAC